ncbi:hypothetical protein IKS57_02790 [bacterium]|nr:hypothetical protein [bacterium]
MSNLEEKVYEEYEKRHPEQIHSDFNLYEDGDLSEIDQIKNEILLDYITDLQEENNKLLDKVRDREKLIVENTQLKRDRIDKAIEYITSDEYDFDDIVNSKQILIDILKGDDK